MTTMVHRHRTTRVRATLLVGATIALVAVLVLALLGPTSTTHVSRPGTRPTPFAASSIWNAPVSAQAPVAPSSATLVAELERQVSSYGPWINTYAYSSPVYTVPSNQPRIPVVLDPPSGSPSAARLAQVLQSGVPIPPDARAAPGTDEAMVVWQPSSDTMWELWIAHRVGSIWHAQWGGRMDGVSSNPGYFDNPPDWGTSATSLALLGGTIRISELRAGHIDHALAISIPQARQGVIAFPAQRTDGKLNSPNAIPEGTRFRLDPRLDVNRLGLPPLTRMLAEAAQRYGIFVRDQSGTVSFYGEQNTEPGPDPYYGRSGLFAGEDPRKLTESFPWSHLQVVSAPLRSYP
jgi:hypothetical protein